MKKAFTLIELLVVVLIIGILAAIALPKYQVAVAKARLATVIPTVASMKQAAEAYYMANGEYVNSMNTYDISFPDCHDYTDSYCRTSKGITFDIHTGSDMCGFTDVAGIVMDKDNNTINSYGMCLDHSDLPGKIYCGAAQGNSAANQVCTNMGGTFAKTSVCFYQNVACNMYWLR